jgi:RHS repeat-associated protein
VDEVGGPTAGSTRYTYDRLGALIGVLNAANTQTSIGYDGLGRKRQLVDPDSGTWQYSYDGLGRLVQQTDAKGQTLTFQYDNASRVTQKLGTPPGGAPSTLATYTYDSTAGGNRGLGRRTGMSDASGNTSYTSDERDRLTSASVTNPPAGTPSSFNYSYNSLGNITAGPLGTYSYGTGRPHAVTSAGPNTYTYDANGAVLGRTESGTSYTHTYDLEGRQSSVTVGGVTTTFVSNGEGQLVAKQVGGTTVAHYVAGGTYERDPSTGATRTTYTFAGRTVAVRDSATGLHYLHQDHLGSTSLQTSSTGAWEGHEVRGPFGQPWLAAGSFSTDQRYTGQRSFEAGSSGLGGGPALGSLLHYQARWYSPVLGRFLSPDTIVPDPGNPQDLNRYSYVRNNPLTYTDPTGHCVFAGADTVACVAGGALVVSAVGVTTAFMGEHFVWGPNAADNREAFASPVVGAINFAREAGSTLSSALGRLGEASTPGGADPEDPWRELRERGPRNSEIGRAWENEVRHYVGGQKRTVRTQLDSGKYKNVDLDSYVPGKGNFEAKVLDWEAKTYQSEAAIKGRLSQFARQLKEQRLALQQHELGDQLIVWFRDAPPRAAAMGKEQIERYLKEKVTGLTVQWGRPG